MRTPQAWIQHQATAYHGSELHLFLAYASLTLRPGAAPPKMRPQQTTPPRTIPNDWTDDEHKLFIEEARLDVTNQHGDKRDIRARAQINLTTAVLVAGLLVTSYTGKTHLCLSGHLLYGLAAATTGLSILASAGLISARSDIGTVSIPALTHYDTGEIHQTVAQGYASTRIIGAETVAVMVTVLRDSVTALVVGSALAAVAHVLT